MADVKKEIRFMKHYVTDGENKVRVSYSAATLIGGRKAVTLYAKEYGNTALGKMFLGVSNETDIMTDYFDKDKFRIFPHDPLFNLALARCQYIPEGFFSGGQMTKKTYTPEEQARMEQAHLVDMVKLLANDLDPKQPRYKSTLEGIVIHASKLLNEIHLP